MVRIAMSDVRAAGLELEPSHARQLFEESAISLDVASERGYRSVDNSQRANYQLQGWHNLAAAGPGLEIPIHGVDGPTSVCQLKPNKPYQHKMKYVWPQGENMHIDVHPRVQPLLAGLCDLWITEGTKKADSAISNGIPCVIALAGVSCWRGMNAAGGNTALADWNSINLYKRNAIICFDSDAMTKPEVMAELQKLWAFVASKGAYVKACMLPKKADGSKMGLDDWFALGNTAGQLQEFIVDKFSDITGQVQHSTDDMTTYVQTDGHICMVEVGKEGEYRNKKIANFVITHAFEKEHHDGGEPRLFFVVEGRTSNGRTLRRLEVPADKFDDMKWLTSGWGAACVMEVGKGSKDHVCAAIKRMYFSEDTTVICHVHTGWVTVDGKKACISASGALGEGGIDGSVVTSLDHSVANYMLTDPTPEEVREGVRVDIEQFLKLAPSQPEIAMMLLGATYYAPLCEWLTPTFSMFVVGQTNSYKTETAALMQGHFGAKFTAQALPGTWTSTANFIERQAYLAKDMIFTLDDFKPLTSNAQDMMKKADYVLRNAANRTGRGRLDSSAQARMSYVPRCLYLVTAEEEPEQQSLHTRVVMLTIDRGLIQLPDIARLQEAREDGKLVNAMSGYIKWLAGKSDVEVDLKAIYKESLARLRALNPVCAIARNPSNMAFLATGFQMFVRHAQEIGVVNADEAFTMVERFFTLTSREVAKQEARQTEDQSLPERSINELTYQLRAKKLTLKGPYAENPDLAEAEWGWRVDASGDLSSGGTVIGSVFMPEHGSWHVRISAKSFHDALRATRDHYPAFRRWVIEMEAAGWIKTEAKQGLAKSVVIPASRLPWMFELREDLAGSGAGPHRTESSAF